MRPDLTQTKWTYEFCSGINGGTYPGCAANAVYIIQATPFAADGVTQNGPLAIVHFDSLDRGLARVTQGFDGNGIAVDKQYDSFGRVQQQDRPRFTANFNPTAFPGEFESKGFTKRYG